MVSFATVAGTANSTTSTVAVSPNSVRVGGSSTVTVTLKDANGNPMTTAPTLSDTDGVTIGAASASGNIFTFPVTAPVSLTTPTTVIFTAQVGGNTVGTGSLVVSAYLPVINDGASPVTAQYDFTSGAAKTFTVSETSSNSVFSVSSSNTGGATASIASGVLTVTPVGAGLSTITVSDQYGQNVGFDVSVTIH